MSAEEDAEELYEHAPCGYVSTLPDGTIIRINETLLSWIGRTRDEVIGTRFQALLTVPGRIYHDTHYAPLLTMQGEAKEIAFDLVRPDRPPLPTFVTTTARRGADGKTLSYRTSIFDGSDRRRYEQELLRARAAAERVTSAKDALLSTISHEMRSPLSSILMAAELLEQQDASPEERAQYLKIVQRAGHTVLELVNAILDHSKLQAGAVKWKEDELDLVALVDEIAAIFALKAKVKGIAFVVDRDARLPRRVLGDGFKIGQLLTNLLGNASKFTHRGEIKLELKLLELVQDVAKIQFAVHDTGIGIAPETLDAIFEEFRQASTDTEMRYGGTGLGLAICRKLLGLVGSKMEVQSTLGRGSTFSFVLRLPVAREATRTASATTTALAP